MTEEIRAASRDQAMEKANFGAGEAIRPGDSEYGHTGISLVLSCIALRYYFSLVQDPTKIIVNVRSMILCLDLFNIFKQEQTTANKRDMLYYPWHKCGARSIHTCKTVLVCTHKSISLNRIYAQ